MVMKDKQKEKQCQNCDGTGWNYEPYPEPKRGATGEIENGKFVRCKNHKK